MKIECPICNTTMNTEGDNASCPCCGAAIKLTGIVSEGPQEAPCPFCQKSIPSYAKSCPHCGKSIKEHDDKYLRQLRQRYNYRQVLISLVICAPIVLSILMTQLGRSSSFKILEALHNACYYLGERLFALKYASPGILSLPPPDYEFSFIVLNITIAALVIKAYSQVAIRATVFAIVLMMCVGNAYGYAPVLCSLFPIALSPFLGGVCLYRSLRVCGLAQSLSSRCIFMFTGLILPFGFAYSLIEAEAHSTLFNEVQRIATGFNASPSHISMTALIYSMTIPALSIALSLWRNHSKMK